jgi:Flp pilus assembly pilin Flp
LAEGYGHAEARPIESIENRSIGGAATPLKRKVDGVLRLVAFTQTSVQETLLRLRREEGQTMAEYGVVLAVMVLAVIAAITLLSTRVSSAISSVTNLLP